MKVVSLVTFELDNLKDICVFYKNLLIAFTSSTNRLCLLPAIDNLLRLPKFDIVLGILPKDRSKAKIRDQYNIMKVILVNYLKKRSTVELKAKLSTATVTESKQNSNGFNIVKKILERIVPLFRVL